MRNCSFFFGRYIQGDEYEPIEWIILDRVEARLLLISKYALDCKSYHTKEQAIQWESCYLRRWLNLVFYNLAFTEEERNKIIPVEIRNPNNSLYNSKGGKTTVDKVFLLNTNEARKYFRSYKTRACAGTAFAYERGASIGLNGNCWWWLRSPGGKQNRAAYVTLLGDIVEYGNDSTYDLYAVRPALWIDFIR